MRIDGCIAAVDKEAQLTKSSAVTDKLVDIGVACGRSGTLECKISQMSVEFLRNCCGKGFDSLVILKVYIIGSSQLLGKLKTLVLSVHCYDIVNTHCTQNCDTNQANGSASLNHHSGIETENAGALCPLYGMDKHCTRLNQYSGIQIKVTHVKYRGAAPDQNVIGKPAVQMNIVIGKQSVYIRAPHVLLVQVVHGNIGIVLKDHTGHYLIPDFQVFARAVLFNVLTHLYDFAGSFMPQGNGNQAERISLELMGIGTADAAALYLYQNVVIANLRHGKFLNIEML